MRIKVDNREKEHAHILDYFNSIGLVEVDKKAVETIIGLEGVYIINDICSIGDYCNLDKPNLFIERKSGWDEFAGNCGRHHARFKRELERLDECGGKMIVLIETTLPLSEWVGKRTRMKADVMQKIINSWSDKHNIEFVQCDKSESGKLIFNVLKEGDSNE